MVLKLVNYLYGDITEKHQNEYKTIYWILDSILQTVSIPDDVTYNL